MTFALDPVANAASIRPLAAFAQSEPQTIQPLTWSGLAWQRVDVECRDVLFDPDEPTRVLPTAPGSFWLRFAFQIEYRRRSAIGYGPGAGGLPWAPVHRLLLPTDVLALALAGEGDEPFRPEIVPIAWDGLVSLREDRASEVLVWWGGPEPLVIDGGQAHMVIGRLD